MDFIDFVKAEKKCSHNTTIKHVQIFKKMYKIAFDNRWVEANAFAGIKLGLKRVTRHILSQEEIDRIAEKKLQSQRIELARDYFIFSCYTGLAYIDLMELRRKNLRENFGRTWINIERVKTNVTATIPILAPAKMILEKYYPNWKNADPETRIFHTLSNQKLNSYLKEVADVCGIDKQISFHIARHTFATTVTLANNIPIETVSKMLGHSRISMTQHYAKVIDQKVARDMQQLGQLLDDQYFR